MVPGKFGRFQKIVFLPAFGTGANHVFSIDSNFVTKNNVAFSNLVVRVLKKTLRSGTALPHPSSGFSACPVQWRVEPHNLGGGVMMWLKVECFQKRSDDG